MRLLLILVMTTSVAIAAEEMGRWVHFNLTGIQMENKTFEKPNHKNGSLKNLHIDEVLKVQLHPTGRKNERPTTKTPVWLSISARDDRHQWVLPWTPGGGHPQQWLEVLLCDNDRSLEMIAETNSSTYLPMRWRVSTENVKLGERGTRMKSTLADVSYRRFSWPDQEAKAVDVEVSVISGPQVCASLAVARRCVTHPHELTDSHLLQRVLFAHGARFSISRSDAPHGFWLYLIPEPDNTLCPMTEHRGLDSLPPPAKTIELSYQTRDFELGGTTKRPQADYELPRGDLVLVGARSGDWAQTPSISDCERQCHQQCILA